MVDMLYCDYTGLTRTVRESLQGRIPYHTIRTPELTLKASHRIEHTPFSVLLCHIYKVFKPQNTANAVLPPNRTPRDKSPLTCSLSSPALK